MKNEYDEDMVNHLMDVSMHMVNVMMHHEKQDIELVLKCQEGLLSGVKATIKIEIDISELKIEKSLEPWLN
mgnify:FL=1